MCRESPESTRHGGSGSVLCCGSCEFFLQDVVHCQWWNQHRVISRRSSGTFQNFMKRVKRQRFLKKRRSLSVSSVCISQNANDQGYISRAFQTRKNNHCKVVKLRWLGSTNAWQSLAPKTQQTNIKLLIHLKSTRNGAASAPLAVPEEKKTWLFFRKFKLILLHIVSVPTVVMLHYGFRSNLYIG